MNTKPARLVSVHDPIMDHLEDTSLAGLVAWMHQEHDSLGGFQAEIQCEDWTLLICKERTLVITYFRSLNAVQGMSAYADTL